MHGWTDLEHLDLEFLGGERRFGETLDGEFPPVFDLVSFLFLVIKAVIFAPPWSRYQGAREDLPDSVHDRVTPRAQSADDLQMITRWILFRSWRGSGDVDRVDGLPCELVAFADNVAFGEDVFGDGLGLECVGGSTGVVDGHGGGTGGASDGLLAGDMP